MKRQCCVCGVFMGEKEPLENKEITHGYCNNCLTEFLRKNGMKEAEIKNIVCRNGAKS